MVKILVADDEPIEKAVVKKILDVAFEGEAQTCLACNGREAMEVYEKEKCDIALLDISMPGINGLEAAEEIRKKHENSVIVFLTAYDDFEYAQKAIRVRALDYLLKPVDEDELVAVLEDAIRLTEEGKPHRYDPYSAMPDKQEQSNMRQAAIKKQIAEYIEENYVNDISLSDAASAMHYSDPHFCKIFKECFGKSFTLYLTELRIEKSKELLGDITVNVKDISAKVGFRDSNYYAKVFKRSEGMTPSEYRIIRGLI
ncbi:MAG: response regulator [Lachnospiraceae bacterium]|nr:response regulator [Lachnospiraceae bacterium]